MVATARHELYTYSAAMHEECPDLTLAIHMHVCMRLILQ